MRTLEAAAVKNRIN